MGKSDAVMLPGNVRPTKYVLNLAPDLEKFTFEGRESVEVEVLEPTDSITLNCAEIAVQAARLTTGDGGSFAPAETTLDEEKETVAFRFDSTLPLGAAMLEIEFTGELNDKLRGFYRSRYTDEAGQERHLATTQFEATDARRAFPCWDEPSLKATFQVTLDIPSGLVALSNMPIVSTTEQGHGLSRVEFGETPVMSTYLLALIVGDLKSIEQKATDGTLIRIWATPGKEQQGGFSLDLSVKLLDYFNDYFDVPYPLEKLDHIAIPDFAAGAMENWGAITYRETALLVDPQQSSAATRQIVAATVAHEMAHMWFGDLVTMEWWDALWLNESFASWMGTKSVDHLFPEWELWTEFVSMDTNRALVLDGLQNSHPIHQEVADPAEIRQLFDAISYSKGGAVLRMLEQFLGADVFRQGLRAYIAEHKYANARTDDLWNALGAASGLPVAAMMDTWVNQTGYPVVDVETSRGGGEIAVSASQRRFVYEHLIDQESQDHSLWRVPLSATGGVVDAEPALMEGRDAKITVATSDGDDGWVKVNPGQTGFYRVNYSAEDWAKLMPAVKGLELSGSDRLGVQNDAYALSKAGFLPVTQFLELAQAYVNDTDSYVWEDLAANLRSLDNLLAEQAFHPQFRVVARDIFRPVARRMGWTAREDEGHLDALLRSTVLGEVGDYGDEETLDQARALFDTYSDDPDRVHPDIRRVVLGLAAKRADRGMYDRLWKLYEQATLEEEKVRLLGALTRVESPELLNETLERSLSEAVRSHDSIRVVVRVAANHQGRDAAWEFVKANWAEFDQRYGKGGFALMELVGIAAKFSTQERLEDVQQFFEENPAPAADRSIKQSVEVVRLNIAWLKQNRDSLAAWLTG